jgi:hypothetical protein
MENTQDANAVSSRMRQILDMVSKLKHDERMKVAYVKSFERDELIRQEVREEMQAELDRTKAEAAEAKALLSEKDKRIEALEKQIAELRKMAGSAAHMTYESE